MRSGATRPVAVVRRLAGPTAWSMREPERGLDRRGAELALDRARGSRRARRAGAACGGRAARRRSASPPSRIGKRSRSWARDLGARRGRAPGGRRSGRPARAGPRRRRAGRGRPGSGSACARAAGRAAGRPRRCASAAQVSSSRTTEPIAGRAAARVAVGDGRLEAGLPARGRRERLDRGVEMAQVRRPQDDLGEEPVERGALEADALRWWSIAERATQPPRPNRSRTMSPGADDGLEAGGHERRRAAAARTARTPAG